MLSNCKLEPARQLATGLALVCFAAASTIFPKVSAATCVEAETAERAGNALIEAARSGSKEAFSTALGTHADMKSIAVFALGKYRKHVLDTELEAFVSLTQTYVARTFNDYRLKFKAQRLDVSDCRGGLVHSKLEPLGNARVQPVQWRVAKGKVIDVNVQNIWLGQLLRSKFSDVLGKSGGDIQALYTHLKK